AMINIKHDRMYLTSTERLARAVLRNFRTQCMDEKKRGWESLQAMGLNTWFARTWSESWPEEIPAPDLYRLNLWKELAVRMTPPSPLSAGTNLAATLDENYGTMVRHGLDPATGFPSTTLVEWRRKISAVFTKSLKSASLFHPSCYPALIRHAITEGKIILPDRITLTGFESPAPVERELFTALEENSDVEYANPPTLRSEKIEALALPSPEQEVIYLVHRLAGDARATPLHRIGVVVPDMDRYAKMLERNLGDITAKVAPHGFHWSNITKGVTLLKTHLMNAALLPLRFILEGQTRELLLSLFLSPHYGCWQDKRNHIARADIVWRKHSIDSGLDNLLQALKREDPSTYDLIPPDSIKHISLFNNTIQISEKKKGAFWTGKIREVWTRLGFPVVSGEKDTVDRRGLDEIMEEIDRHLSDVLMDGHEFSAWLTHLASRKVVQIGAAEDAGIQIMGTIESRGLDFDKLYILGMDDRSLPEPVRPLPFLDSTERRLVQGGTAESQYEFAKRAFNHLMALAPDITLLRAEVEDLKPLAPSPFWPDAEEKRSIDIWNTPDPAWLRAEWLRSAYEGLDEEITSGPSPESLIDLGCIPETISVSRFQKAVICPYRFFVEGILKINPLDEIEPDASPREKGNRIHQTLALFTQQLRERGIDINSEEAMGLLTTCVDDTLHGVSNSPHWEVERRRWIGDPDGGILTDWLDKERERWFEGWRCIAEESTFDALTIAGLPFTLKGRIDRVDLNKEKGVLLWDYKTGTPSKAVDITKYLKDPQLVIYLLALLGGHIPALEPYIDSDTPLSAGYIGLKSSGDIKFFPIKGIESSIEEWAVAIAKLGEMLGSGDFRAEPFPVSEVTNPCKRCEECPDITLCRTGVRDQRARNEKIE
ncbi:MAG: PD-(D/E)XK nuclease family protein, partial [Thermodesulfobacteriota bacterium]|nr:PD-(D/E)XK nuclease family protein [Thermodesulfobacteriota bacterium]